MVSRCCQHFQPQKTWLRGPNQAASNHMNQPVPVTLTSLAPSPSCPRARLTQPMVFMRLNLFNLGGKDSFFQNDYLVIENHASMIKPSHASYDIRRGPNCLALKSGAASRHPHHPITPSPHWVSCRVVNSFARHQDSKRFFFYTWVEVRGSAGNQERIWT